MRLLPKLFCFLLTVEGARGFLTDVEWNVVLRLVEKFHVKRVIFAPETLPPQVAPFLKRLSGRNVAWVFSRRQNLQKYLRSPYFAVFPWTAIVVKETDLTTVGYLDDPSVIPSFFWLLFDGSNGTLREQLKDVHVPINTGFFLIERSTPDHYVLSEYYQIKKCTRGLLQEIAEWKNNDLVLSRIKWYNRKSNFHGYELSTVKFNENLYLTPKEKVNEAIWRELSELLNFTLSDTGRFSPVITNFTPNTRSFFVIDLLRQQVVFVMGNLTRINQKLIQYSPKNGSVELVKEEDEALLDTAIYIGNTRKFRYLLGPTSQSKIYMHVKAEGEYKGLKRFLMPFSRLTWWSVGLWLCCCATFFCFIEYFSRKLSENSTEGWYHVAFTPLDSLCSQCGTHISSNLTARLMFLVIKSSSCVIFHSYGATLISYLLLYMPELPFADLKGFVEDGSYKIIGERNSDVDAFFNVSVVPLERLVYTKFLVDATKWERLDKEIDRMCAGEKLVLVAYDNDVDKYKPCHIVKMRKPLKVVANGFKIRFKSPFRGLLHIKLLLLRSTGVLNKLNNEIPRRSIRHGRSKNEFKVSIEKVSSAFFILLTGQFAAAVVLLIEVSVVKCERIRGNKRR